MTRPGRLVRELMRPDSARAVEERIAIREATAQANAEMLERFPLDPATLAASSAWRETRTRELVCARLGRDPWAVSS